MADLRKLKDQAAELAAKGKLEKAADVYHDIVRADPRDVGSRQRLAEVLRRAGHTGEAILAYRAVAERFARDGFLLKAIAISKIILELDPRHVETQAALAELYARKAGVDGTRPPPARDAEERSVALPLPPPPAAAWSPDGGADELPPELVLDAAPPDGPSAFERIVLAAAEARDAGVEDEEEILFELEPAADEPPEARAPRGDAVPPPPACAAELPRVPFLSDLGHDAFVALTGAMALRRAGAGEIVVEEGDTGTSFYVVVSGRLRVSKRDEQRQVVLLARLGEGDFFGEMALLSGAPRAATVTAEEASELLEFRADALRELAGEHPHLAASLRRFYRQRLLANAMAVSPLFRPFSRGDRKLVMERFRAREVREGEVVIREGEPSDGLYVVLSGAVAVTKRRAGAPVLVGTLREGDVFGEVSCLRKTPALASVVVRRGGTLLRLPRAEFDDLVVTYPQILELVSELTDERTEGLDAILSGHARWTDEGLVLV